MVFAMPEVVAITKTFVLVKCELLTQENKPHMEKICKRCGILKDGKRKGIHVVCLHPESPYWPRFIKAVKDSKGTILKKIGEK